MYFEELLDVLDKSEILWLNISQKSELWKYNRHGTLRFCVCEIMENEALYQDLRYLKVLKVASFYDELYSAYTYLKIDFAK